MGTPGKVYGVSLVILGKTKAVRDTNCKPYDSAHLYDKSKDGIKRKIEYFSTEKGKEAMKKAMKKVEASEKGKKRKNEYFSTEKGKEAMKKVEASEKGKKKKN